MKQIKVYGLGYKRCDATIAMAGASPRPVWWGMANWSTQGLPDASRLECWLAG